MKGQKNLKKQECISVGCVPSAAVAMSITTCTGQCGYIPACTGQGGVCILACTGQGVSAQGGCLPGDFLLRGVCIPACTEVDTAPVNRMTDRQV